MIGRKVIYNGEVWYVVAVDSRTHVGGDICISKKDGIYKEFKHCFRAEISAGYIRCSQNTLDSVTAILWKHRRELKFVPMITNEE